MGYGPPFHNLPLFLNVPHIPIVCCTTVFNLGCSCIPYVREATASNSRTNHSATQRYQHCSRLSTQGSWKGALSEKLILIYLNPSPVTAKRHMKHPCHGIQSTQPKPTTTAIAPTPILPSLPLHGVDLTFPAKLHPDIPHPALLCDNNDKSITNIFCLQWLNRKLPVYIIRWECVLPCCTSLRVKCHPCSSHIQPWW